MQATLLGHEAPGFDAAFTSIQVLFAHLERALAWHTSRRQMYDQVVDVPRLTAGLPDDGPGHPLLHDIAAALGERYGLNLPRIHLALYCHGRDSVAWHADRVGKVTETTVVGIVSLGAPRRFLLRPKSGGPARRFELGWGDLLVMGGTCQRTFEHAVPKEAHVAARKSAASSRWKWCSAVSTRGAYRPRAHAPDAIPRCTRSEIEMSSSWVASLLVRHASMNAASAPGSKK